MAQGPQTPPKRRLLNRWEIFLLIIVGAIILYVVLQRFGVNIVYRTETEELLHQPHRD